MEEVQKFLLDVGEGISQHGTGVDSLALVNEEARDPQCSDRSVGLFVVVLEVIINKPVDAGINRHIDFGVVEGGNAGQDDR